MKALGYNTYAYKLTAYVIAGGMCGLAGALLGNFTTFISPDMMGWSRSGELMFMVILGGTGSLFGPVFAAGSCDGYVLHIAGGCHHELDLGLFGVSGDEWLGGFDQQGPGHVGVVGSGTAATGVKQLQVDRPVALYRYGEISFLIARVVGGAYS